MSKRPRLLIEDWLPAAAIGVECMRERGSASALAPHTYFHVWWARRPLTVSRAAVLGSLLPADFPHDAFERLLGFGHSAKLLVEYRKRMDAGEEVPGGFNCDRAFKRPIPIKDRELLAGASQKVWGKEIIVIDPMSGGGSIPLESARMGFKTLGNEYNPVACSILEATVDYSFRFGEPLGRKTREWGAIWEKKVNERVAIFFPKRASEKIVAYIYARAVPCPDTGFLTPLVPDWHLSKPKTGRRVVAEPVVDKNNGTWSVQIKEIGNRAGQLKAEPVPTYDDGKGISLFTGKQIPADYIKAKAQAGKMVSVLYAVAYKAAAGAPSFRPPEDEELKALRAAEKELKRLRPAWEKGNIIPTEKFPEVTTDLRPINYGMPYWADMYTPRQLLAAGVMVEELNALRSEIVKKEGKEIGEAVVHLIAMATDKFLNHNCCSTRWENTHAVIKGKMDRHDYSFKATFAEMAPCNAGSGLAWAIDNVLEAYEEISKLPRSESAQPVELTMGSATNLAHLEDGSITAVVVDPPYADNVQYSELADFFYVWLKRMQGHRRPEWFSTYLCDHDHEAVVNVSRHKDADDPKQKTKDAKVKARAFYQKMMSEVFAECRRILRDDGVLTVMFTHKKQEEWESLFAALIAAGFTITATWPVKTESEHSLHQAKKNAAQSTVVLVARKRDAGAGVGYFNADLKNKIRTRARESAERLHREGLNPVDQLVGSFGPAMEVYSLFDEVKTDTGVPVGVGQAIDEAADAVSTWRIEQLAKLGLDNVEAEGKFALLCWDVLGAAEFRFNEAKLLGHAVGMDIDQLVTAGLVSKSGDKVNILSAKARRRAKALEPDAVVETLLGPVAKTKKRTKKSILQVHPNDPKFRTALDACHALALRYEENGGGAGGIGAARALVRQQQWNKESAVARLMEALVNAAPEALRFVTGKTSAAAQFPEFRAWHALLDPLFGIKPPHWQPAKPASPTLLSHLEPEAGESEADGEDSAG